MANDKELSPAVKIFSWRGNGAATAPARAALSAPDRVASEKALSPTTKIFAWRGYAKDGTPLAAATAPDSVPITTEPVAPMTLLGGVVMNSSAFPDDVLKKVATALSTSGSVPAVTTVTPPSTPSQVAVFVDDEAGVEEYADYTLRAWKDGELAKHLTIRLKKARALQFMHCFAANCPFGSDVGLYVGQHEHAANIPIEKLVSEVQVRRSGP